MICSNLRRYTVTVGLVSCLLGYLASRSCAQYPQYTGWIAQPRPGGYGSGIYDWTGLTLSWTNVPFYGPSSSGSQTFYAFLNQTGGSAGGPTGTASSTYGVNGTSTFKWKWVPRDMNGDGQPDVALFPVDPLFVLTKLGGGVEAWPHVQPPTGLGASGSISDGIDWTRSFQGIPGTAPPAGESPRRRIAGAGISGDMATVTMSPSLTVTISGTQNGAPGSSSICSRN